MTQTTQCPACQTRFKVSDAQLSAARGFVRCGRCAHIFNAIEHRVAPPVSAPKPQPAPPPAAPAADIDDFELEVPDFDPNAAALSGPAAAEYPPEFGPADDATAPSREDVEAFQQALNEALHSSPVTTPIGNPFDEPLAPPPAPQTEADQAEDDVPAIFDTRRTANTPDDEEEELSPIEADAATRIQPEPAPATEASLYDPARDGENRKPRSALQTILILFGSVLALLLLAGQLVYTNRTLIAAQAPDMRPPLERLCKKFGCTVPYPTDQEYIRTEWSELSFVPEHANLVQLSATLKNHAPYPQAFPMLEVTLKDADNQVLIRKVFTPRDYLRPDHQKLNRFAANTEEKITMRFDVGKVHAQGYSLYWFYP
jgi:predicted Zn finger-like uncharacterized protein